MAAVIGLRLRLRVIRSRRVLGVVVIVLGMLVFLLGVLVTLIFSHGVPSVRQ
jgi:hypothetical protein